MKDFLISLSFGLDERLVVSEYKELLRELLQCQILSKHKNKFYLNNGFVFGKMDISSKGTGYVELWHNENRSQKDLLVESKDLNTASLGDIVACRLYKQKGRLKARVILVLKRTNESFLVMTKKHGKMVLGTNLQSGLSVPLKASQKSLNALPLGTILKIRSKDNEIIEVLGHIDDEKVDEKISLALFNKNDEFDALALAEAAAWGEKIDINLYENRLDLRNLGFCTIDPIDAKDFDDAIYYDERAKILYVAIADVSEYVYVYGAIDKEARYRGFSIYLPHRAIPMLPSALSEGLCSLKPNEDRLVFGFKISLDEKGEVLKEELFEGIIHSKRRFHYDEVDEFLEKKADLKECNFLHPLFTLTQILRKKRLKNAFEFKSKELRMSLNEKGELQSTRYESDTPSHKLIEECMLLANKAAAKLITKGVFRNHLSPDYTKISKLSAELALLGIDAPKRANLSEFVRGVQVLADELGIREEVDKLIIKAQKRAEYASENFGHFGLGFDKYTHFTSPIRRYSDLTLHRLLKAKMKNDEKTFNYLLLNINSLCESLSLLEREADKVAWDFMDRKFARWAKRNLHQKFEALIIENQNTTIAKLDDEIKGGTILLYDFGLSLFERVRLEITEADIVFAKVFGKVRQILSDKENNV